MVLKEPHLSLQVQIWILSFNSDLPEENSTLWVTVDEMHNRLMKGGVDRSFTIEMLKYGLHRANRGNMYLLRRPDDKETYYRPTKYIDDDEMPVDQPKRLS